MLKHRQETGRETKESFNNCTPIAAHTAAADGTAAGEVASTIAAAASTIAAADWAASLHRNHSPEDD